MSTTTNIILKEKQLFHNAASTSNAVSDAVDDLKNIVLYVRVGGPGVAVNDYTIVCPPVNTKLESAHFIGEAMTNASGDDVVMTIATNGVTVDTYNSNASATGAVAANTLTDMSITNTNSYVDAGESCIIAWTMADATNNNLNGTLRLVFSRQ